MRRGLKFAGVTVGLVSVLALGACGSDDDEPDANDSTPTPSPSATPAEYQVVCPDPIGTVTVTVKDDEDEWAPAYVKGSDVILDPIAFGEITFTETATGQTEVVGQPETKPGADTTGAVDCTFTSIVTDAENDEGGAGTINGSVTVVKRP